MKRILHKNSQIFHTEGYSCICLEPLSDVENYFDDVANEINLLFQIELKMADYMLHGVLLELRSFETPVSNKLDLLEAH